METITKREISEAISVDSREYVLVDVMDFVKEGWEVLKGEFLKKGLLPYIATYQRTNNKRESKKLLVQMVVTKSGEYKKY